MSDLKCSEQVIRFKGGIYDQQDATNSQYFIVMIALHVSGDHCPLPTKEGTTQPIYRTAAHTVLSS
jgi:hypothetical protein